MPAELILTNGRIYTADAASRVAEALATRSGRVLVVGRAADVSPHRGPGTRVVDLGGRAVVPGLIDAHVHLLSFALGLGRVDLVGAPTLEAGLERVRAGVAAARAGEWIVGSGWDKNLWGGLPTRQALDAVAPDNPVVLASRDLHVQWANTLALRLAGVDASTPDPAGGEIVRDAATGEPTGILREAAGGLVAGVVPPPSAEQCEAALVRALEIAASRGLTGLQTFEGQEVFSALQRLRSRGALRLRVCCHLWREGLPDARRLGLRTGFGDEWLRLGHLKLFLDGALGSQTAHLLEPYSGTDRLGIPTMTRAELRDTVREAASAGIATAVHAIGDAANRLALDVYEETAPLWRSAGLRPRIEHVQLLHPADAGRLGWLGIVASMQPSHAPSDWRVAERYWAGRTGLAYAWRTILASGAVLAFGSDCPVEPLDPLAGLHAAITRQTAAGEPAGGWHPEQRLTPGEALRAFTVGAAYSTGEENVKGSLAAGKLADFVVLSDDPLDGPPERLLRTRVAATVVGGEVIYGEL